MGDTKLKFIENVKASFTEDTAKDKGNLVETVLIISGFAMVAIVLTSWVGSAIAGQAANVSACIASSNAGGISEACSEDSFDVKNTVNSKIAAQGAKFGISSLPSGGAPAAGGTPTPTPSPSPTTNPNLAPAQSYASSTYSALNSSGGQVSQAYNAYNLAMSLPPSFGNPSVVMQIQQHFETGSAALSNASNALSSARSNAQAAASLAQQLGNSQAAAQAQAVLTQISNAQASLNNAINYANQTRQFSSGGVVRNQSSYAMASQITIPTVNTAMSQVNSAISATNALQTTLNNIRA